MRPLTEALALGLRADDLVFRRGPSGFALLLDGITPASAAHVAGRLREIVLERAEEQAPGRAAAGLRVHVGVAAGIGPREDFIEVLRQAEAGMRAQRHRDAGPRSGMVPSPA
nr:diguanylate cyclase [Pararoseomonas baculiformis]